MPLKRISKQGSETLPEFYNHLQSYSECYINLVNNMLFIINSIDTLFVSTDIWALTSVHRLVLLEKDDWKSDWLITIWSNEHFISIEYMNTQTQKKEVIETLRENFIDNLLVAMQNTRGYENSIDIDQHLN